MMMMMLMSSQKRRVSKSACVKKRVCSLKRVKRELSKSSQKMTNQKQKKNREKIHVKSVVEEEDR